MFMGKTVINNVHRAVMNVDVILPMDRVCGVNLGLKETSVT